MTKDNVIRDLAILKRERKGRFVLFGELEAHCSKQWLVKDFLGDGEVSAFYGMPGSGKSVLIGDMGMHVAAGIDWHGRKVRQGAVVCVALERRRIVERRAIAFRKKHGARDLPFAIVGGPCDLRNPNTAAWLAEVVVEVETETKQPVVLIIIDTLSRALCGGDENSPKDMGAIVHATSILQDRTGAHVAWVHHVPLDASERMRGHGALLGALDTAVFITKGDGVRTATIVKASDAEEGERVAFILETVVISEPDAEETSAPVVVPVQQTSTGPTATNRLKGAAKVAYEALCEAISETGSVPSATSHVPANTRTTPFVRWRQYCETKMIAETDKPDSKRRAFVRAAQRLQDLKVIGIWNDQVWVAGHVGQHRT